MQQFDDNHKAFVCNDFQWLQLSLKQHLLHWYIDHAELNCMSCTENESPQK